MMIGHREEERAPTWRSSEPKATRPPEDDVTHTQAQYHCCRLARSRDNHRKLSRASCNRPTNNQANLLFACLWNAPVNGPSAGGRRIKSPTGDWGLPLSWLRCERPC